MFAAKERKEEMPKAEGWFPPIDRRGATLAGGRTFELSWLTLHAGFSGGEKLERGRPRPREHGSGVAAASGESGAGSSGVLNRVTGIPAGGSKHTAQTEISVSLAFLHIRISKGLTAERLQPKNSIETRRSRSMQRRKPSQSPS
jgi:hypothetical protein